MNAVAVAAKPAAETTQVDVLIVGAGVAGIGSAVHLLQQCPGKSFAILEMKDSFGGTWLTNQYPGIRSDSDLYTYGYRFKPWVGPPIATGEAIRDYMREVIDEHGIASQIHYGHRISHASWSSADKLWSITATRFDGTSAAFTCNFLWMCQGYYDHDQPYMPDWPGAEQFGGLLVHAQLWDPTTDYTGKKVVVIGSGASAATIVPAMADNAAKVTMLQRSPTYFFCMPNTNELADRMRLIGIDEPTIHRVVRESVNHDFRELTRRSVDEPDAVFEELKELIRLYAGADFEFEPHFTPRYRVWQQRMAIVPDGDMFQAIAAGKVDVVTDEIDHFTAHGIVTKGGTEIPADIVIAATGFRLKVMGGIAFAVDGKPVDFSETVSWRGMMFSDVPNLAWMMVYFRASATLRVDLIGDFVCRLLHHMDQRGSRQAEVRVPEADAHLPRLPWIEEENFNPNYLTRDLDKLPKRIDRPEWRDSQDYWYDRDTWPLIDLDGPEFVYDGVRAGKRQETVAA
jgi:cation diffusion facilitator CzcD-associated flavoprotein CzcO